MPDIYISQLPEENSSLDPKTKIVPQNQEPQEKKRPLAAFVVNPTGIHFENQDKDEKIILFLRMHWITNLRWLVITIALILAPLILHFFPLIGFLPFRFQLIAVLMWYLLVLAFIFENFLVWFFNTYIVTDERVIDIDFCNLLYKQVAETNVDKIQDITYNMGGAIRTLFNYGDVLIQTASEHPNFEFEAVPRPDQVAKILQGLMVKENQELEGRAK